MEWRMMGLPLNDTSAPSMRTSSSENVDKGGEGGLKWSKEARMYLTEAPEDDTARDSTK